MTLPRRVGGSENRVFQSSTGLRLEFTDDIYDHETRPAPGREKTDERFLIGIGLKLD
jgi:hypothetical protein